MCQKSPYAARVLEANGNSSNERNLKRHAADLHRVTCSASRKSKIHKTDDDDTKWTSECIKELANTSKKEKIFLLGFLIPLMPLQLIKNFSPALEETNLLLAHTHTIPCLCLKMVPTWDNWLTVLTQAMGYARKALKWNLLQLLCWTF